VGITLQSKQGVQQVTRVVGHEIHTWIVAREPSGEQKIVRGKPYISVNSATMNAENAPNDRQSRLVFGRVKLKANMMKKADSISTIPHRPYALAS
jgi:hypothetical protein